MKRKTSARRYPADRMTVVDFASALARNVGREVGTAIASQAVGGLQASSDLIQCDEICFKGAVRRSLWVNCGGKANGK